MLDKLLAAGAEFVSGSLILQGRVVGRSTVNGVELFEDVIDVAPAPAPVEEPVHAKRGRKPKAADVSAQDDFDALINELTAE
jgi:hypothetical protein